MNEHLIALNFYRSLIEALKSDGIAAVVVTLDKDGQLQADIMPPDWRME